MGYIICDIHGGNVASFIAKYHVEKIKKMEESNHSEILNVDVLDKKGLFNGTYIVDPTLVNEIGIKDSKIDLEFEFEKYEMMFEKLNPVCPKCLNDYLKKR